MLHVGLPALSQVALPYGWRANNAAEREGLSREHFAPAPVHQNRNGDPIAQLRRAFARICHSQQTEQIKVGLVGLLLLCANASDGRRKSDLPLAEIPWKMRAAARRPQSCLRAFGARPLLCGEAPGLYAILLDICMRAGLRRVPELYLLPFDGMNAYALGGPDNACISVTEGLLRGLSRQEIAGIFAHEVAHILHHDDHAMNWAGAVQHAITELAACCVQNINFGRGRSADAESMLLASAPLLARLLTSALSRVRELAADSRAIDLIEHPGALVDALCKLEVFHTGLSPHHAPRRNPGRALHSHPETWERIAYLS